MLTDKQANNDKDISSLAEVKMPSTMTSPEMAVTQPLDQHGAKQLVRLNSGINRYCNRVQHGVIERAGLTSLSTFNR